MGLKLQMIDFIIQNRKVSSNFLKKENDFCFLERKNSKISRRWIPYTPGDRTAQQATPVVCFIIH